MFYVTKILTFCYIFSVKLKTYQQSEGDITHTEGSALSEAHTAVHKKQAVYFLSKLNSNTGKSQWLKTVFVSFSKILTNSMSKFWL